MTLTAPVEHGWADTAMGPIHYVTAGSGHPVLLLHQTPRSWDEYRDVVPIIGAHHRAIAMDSLGFGDTPMPVGEELTIEMLARGAVALLDALGITRCTVVGHHTGGIVGLELCAAHGDRVERAVLSATPLIDAAWRRRVGDAPRIDAVERSMDGRYMTELWDGRRPFYPADRIDLLERFVVDALRTPWGPGHGHHAVQTYQMEEKVADVRAPVLLVRPMADPFVRDDVPALAAAINAEVVEIEDAMIPLPDQLPERFADVVLTFIDGA